MTVNRPLNEPTYLRVKRAIIDDIVTGEFKPGAHLTIDSLTTRYSVSHMPIREALRQLEGEGILQSHAHRGFSIEVVTEKYLRNIYDIRLGVESMLAYRAVQNATKEDATALRTSHQKLSAIIRSGDIEMAVIENANFHRQLYKIAGNSEAELILEGRTRVVRTVSDSLGSYTPVIFEQIINEHERMVSAVESTDPEAAQHAVFEHISAARERLIEKLSLNSNINEG